MAKSKQIKTVISALQSGMQKRSLTPTDKKPDAKEKCDKNKQFKPGQKAESTANFQKNDRENHYCNI